MSNNQRKDTLLSVLNLSPVVQGGTIAESFRNSMDLARRAEEWGYHRYWLAEHHNIEGVASSATAVLIGHIAGGTKKIRVGSGGIMLPNHSSLVIAEQFGTLETLYPGRIDLGLGRAPGTDQLTARALRRNISSGEDFPEQLEELRNYFKPSGNVRNQVRAIPGEGIDVPIWLLGSSDFSARLAGELGLPFAFAAHFSPANTVPALELYRNSFTPSEVLNEPYAMVGVTIIAADTNEKAQHLATSHYQRFLDLVRGTPNQLKPPVEDMDQIWSPYEKAMVHQQLSSTIVGGPEEVKEKLEDFVKTTQADEIMVNSETFDHADRMRSFEIVADIWKNR
ncbi:LLM class flavin-dependent oxidoreductase [Bacillus mojavensis]|uniref:Luciferase-like monooxygenase YvbT n=1 Tax=Bacillus mojavensis TaxID=72360 RepID=A0ABX6M0S1_BACMO|nr:MULTISPECIES: LLM class flavin-dependent oxidoreductase [Bacillus]MCC2930782.1 LLM class flavin-dependent oxidoreductase [Bacillus sp. LBG-1-113]MCY9090251.1 LLM class flavin-dependent oxidoreductase [Bacillus mojavensis]MDR4228019.1 LLM class flavin-dependent oxidoreductase [Bacillus mojavensis]MEC1623979.1 LLM class flavin-dependent oxidoreductase [Bacillus mojavensis]MEC1680882.1 LLM class flavin-dependent oxidoreductase [Bacillus mojavensis]